MKELVPPNYSGVISLRRIGANESEVLFEEARGYADIPNQRPNRLSTRFGTASAGKALVAVGILKLVEEGLISLDTPLKDIASRDGGFDLGTIPQEVTIRELLTHTSGIGDYFDEETMEEYAELWHDFPNYRIRSSRDLLPLINTKAPAFPRGQRFAYNNAGFVILDLVIETLTGDVFDRYLERTVLGPAGMTRSGYYELDRLPADCANAYIEDPKTAELYTNIYSIDAKGTGAGGAFLCLDDCLAFWQALLGGKLLSPASLEAMLSPHSREEGGDSYGLGIWLRKAPDSEERYIPWFTGSDPGATFISSYDPKDGSIATLFSNRGDNVWELEWKLREAIARG